jgi:hypothetical protein
MSYEGEQENTKTADRTDAAATRESLPQFEEQSQRILEGDHTRSSS